MGVWLLSRSDSTIVARHEVPGLQFGQFEELRRPARPRELSFLGVERGPVARRVSRA
jgi:hypothetical protein